MAVFKTPSEESVEMVEIDRKLWLNEARDGLVEDGDPSAASLYATAGLHVPADEAKALGYKASKGAKDKQASAPQDKAETPQEPSEAPSRRVSRKKGD